MNSHGPEGKRGDFGTDTLGHFYVELKEVTQRNRDGASRQRIIREAVSEGDLLLLELPTRDNPNVVRVCTVDHRQIGCLPGVEGASLLNRLARQYRYAAFVDQVLERELFQGHSRYGVSALIFKVAPGVSDVEIRDYVHDNFHSLGSRVEGAYLNVFGLTPSCEPVAIVPEEAVPAPVPVPQPAPTPPASRDIPKLTIMLESAVLALARFNETLELLLKELNLSGAEEEKRVNAMIEELAGASVFVTEDHARELLRRIG
jgi:hypothetical protein